MEGDKKPRTEAEKRMNDMRKVAQRNLKVIKSKYTPGVDINEVPVAWTDISKLADIVDLVTKQRKRNLSVILKIKLRQLQQKGNPNANLRKLIM
jgi:hypothetical protein